MKVAFNLTEDQLDEIAVVSLKEAYRYNRHPNKIDNSDEYIDPDYAFLNAVDLVLEYYLNAKQMEEWQDEKADM